MCASDAQGPQGEVFFRMLVEHSLDLITVVDKTGTILFRSPATERLLGYNPTDAVGRNLFSLVHPDDLTRVRRAFDDSVEGRVETARVECRLLHKDGTWRTFETVGRYFADLPDGPMGIVHSRDITERTVLEKQLRHAQKMEAMGQMAAAVAHDFNNLLAAILGLVGELLAPDAATGARLREHQAARLGQIRNAAARGRSLTEQLLAFARRGATGEAQAVNVNASVEELAPILVRLVGKGIRIAFELAAGDPVIFINPVVLDQVLINLVANAADATAHMGVVTITTGNRTRGTVCDGSPADVVGYVVIQVIDHGSGMTPEVQARMFEPFFTTKQPGKGVGLGLSTVATIVHRVGGHIDVDTEVGRGTTFRVWLPQHVGPTNREPEGHPRSA